MSDLDCLQFVFRSASRGYTMSVERDLFGTAVLCRRWFGLSNLRGGGKSEVFASDDDARRAIERVRRARLRRGYIQVLPSEATVAIPLSGR